MQLKWQYLQRTFPCDGTLMGPIEEALREKFFPALLGGEDIKVKFRKILGHSVKLGGLDILNPRFLVDSVYNTSKAASGELLDSLIGGSALSYVVHMSYVRGASAGERREGNYVEWADMARQKELSGVQEKNRLHRATSNGAWLIAVPHRLNGIELSR